DSPLLCRQTRMPEPVSTRPAPALFHALYFGQLCSSRTLVASVTTTTAARAAPASSAAATAPPSVTAPSATAALATRPVHLRTRFVDGKVAPSEIRAVQGLHRLACRLIIRHLNEGKSARLTRVAIGNDADLFDWAIGLKQRANLVFSRIES